MKLPAGLHRPVMQGENAISVHGNGASANEVLHALPAQTGSSQQRNTAH